MKELNVYSFTEMHPELCKLTARLVSPCRVAEKALVCKTVNEQRHGNILWHK